VPVQAGQQLVYQAIVQELLRAHIDRDMAELDAGLGPLACLAERFLENELADRLGEKRVVQGSPELARPSQDVAVLPPQQGLEADELAVRQLDFRLIVEQQLSVSKRGACSLCLPRSLAGSR
jgi:hypothetical protein